MLLFRLLPSLIWTTATAKNEELYVPNCVAQDQTASHRTHIKCVPYTTDRGIHNKQIPPQLTTCQGFSVIQRTKTELFNVACKTLEDLFPLVFPHSPAYKALSTRSPLSHHNQVHIPMLSIYLDFPLTALGCFTDHTLFLCCLLISEYLSDLYPSPS